MANPDPIERFAAEVEVYGILQDDGAPPMTESYFHVRRRQDGAAERAVLGLPAYRGEPGPAGPPGAIHQGERTTAQLEALATTLDESHTNYAYRNTDTNDQYVWSGKVFVIYHGVYATPGPVGPAPEMVPGDLTIDGEPYDGEFGVRVSGSDGQYSVGVDLPALPEGPPGPTGPSGSIIESVDVDPGSSPSDGDTLVFDEASGRLFWRDVTVGVEEYAVPPASFPTAINIPSTTNRRELFTLEIPARDYPYRFDFVGGVDVDARIGHLIDGEIRVGDPASGELVGLARGDSAEGWHRILFGPFSDTAFEPGSNTGVVQPGTPVTLYVTLVKRAGVLFGWSTRNDFANLRVRLIRAA